MPEPQLKRRAAALLLSLALTFSLPLSSFAQEEELPDTDQPAVHIEPGEDDAADPETDEDDVQATVAAAQSSDSPLVSLLNTADLNPTDPRSQALDALVDEVMDSILTDDMDTYQQVKACYDYLVGSVSYGSHMSKLGTPVSDSVTCGDIYSAYGEVEGFGAVALTAKTGMCNAYSSAFILMARKIGLTANLVEGSTRNGGGGYSYHKWTEVQIDGGTYVFDPQLEQSLVRSGLPRYTVFGKTYDQIPGRYSKY